MKEHRIFVLYSVYGVGSTAINMAVYIFLTHTLGDSMYQLWNVVAWFFAVLYSFIANEKFVFKIEYKSITEALKKFAGFLSSRLVSLACECGIMFAAVSLMSFNDLIVKLCAGLVGVCINYYFSKKLIFKK